MGNSARSEMSVEVVAGSPLAAALQEAVQPKLAEVGWTTGATDDSTLAEYIILMLTSGKNQDELASDLSSDLLSLGPDDPSAGDFSRWLFEQVHVLNAQINGRQNATADNNQTSQDQPMGDQGDPVQDANIPTGPKSMRNGNPKTRDRRMLGQMNKALDRTSDAGLHRIRGGGGGVGRINSHSNREAPKGPRNMNMATRMQNMSQMNPQMTQNAMMNADPQQQMALYKLLEDQSRMMAQILGPGANAPAINPAFFSGQQPQQPQQQRGKSIFDRIDKPRKNSNFKPNSRQNSQAGDAMDTDAPSETTADGEQKEASTVACRFQLSCTNPSCHFGHQSPAAPLGISLDLKDKCPYGAACTNKKCAASHPSPAQKRQHLSTQVDCKFYPNCTNPNCPFKHPTTPPCRNGADCPERETTCKFSHSDIMCRYTPCLNPNCPYRHADGQKRSANWSADKSHVSDRKFINEDAEEELILPGQQQQQQHQENQMQTDTDVVT